MRSRSPRSAPALLCLLALAASACDTALDQAAGGGDADQVDEGGAPAEPAAQDQSALAEDNDTPPDDVDDGPRDPNVRRGLGSMTARVPGTTEVITGVRLDAHRVRVTIQDGFSRTEVEEEFFNETDRVLEGRYVFPLPPGATVTRLGLWVGADLVEGEIVERRRAAQIFRSIVEDTVRPRDPALLEWVRGGELSLKIFPIPAHSSRKVVLAYDEALETRGGKTRYVHPLSLGAERATRIGDFSVDIRVAGAAEAVRTLATPGWTMQAIAGDATALRFSERDFIPDRDFVVEVAASPTAPNVVVSKLDPLAGQLAGADRRFFSASFALPSHAAQRSLDRVIVLDTSESQTFETIDAQARAARAIVRNLRPEERYAVLACNTQCTSFPATGLQSVESAALGAFLDGLRPRGASDLAASIARGAARLDHGGQIVILHDGKVSAGELAPSAIADRVLPVLAIQGAEVRIVGVGRSVDDVVLQGIVQSIDASYEPLAGDSSLEARNRRLVHDLARPALVHARIELPEGFSDVVPSSWPSLVPGAPIRVFGTVSGEPRNGVARLVGELDGETVELPLRLDFDAEAPANPLLSKLWADRAIGQLETQLEVGGDGASRAGIVEISKAFHVLSRHTSLLVLENERMFREFGVKRTTLKASDQADHGFGGLEVAERAPEPSTRDWGAGETSSPVEGGRAQGSGGRGFGSGQGRLSGSHQTKAPQVRMGQTSVSGRLPPEIVQRIVRQQFGRFRACYEMGLLRKPDLGGRVTVAFVIGRDGLVGSSSDGGSDLPDSEVVSCVVRQFTALSFPQPEGGYVTVIYPIVFQSDGTQPTRPIAEWPMPERIPSPPRTPLRWELEQQEMWRLRSRSRPAPPPVKMIVEHQAGSDEWRTGREADIASLGKALLAAPESRQKRARYVRALLGNGRWARARHEAARFVELDPDLATARELLAQASAVEGDAALALDMLESLAEAEPRSTDAHLRASRGLEAAGETTRSCAHRRTLAELEPNAAHQALADACWDDLLGESISKEELTRAQAGLAKSPPAVFTATVACDDKSITCPDVAVLTPAGRVISRAAPWQAIPIDGGVALSVASTGTYRTIVFGGDPRARGKVTVRAYGTAREVAFGEGDPRTALLTTVDQEIGSVTRW